MKILIIGKYPPIEGGVASRTYWLARGLGERGHQVSVVTNALRVEGKYREQLNLSDTDVQKEYEPKNVKVFSLSTPPPQHIPFSEAYLSRLTSKSLEVIQERGADIVFTHYLEPYGVAGLFIKKLTGIPLVVQHAGSDIYRLLQDTDFAYLLSRVLQEANGVFLGRKLRTLQKTLRIGNKKICTAPLGIHPSFTNVGEGFPFAKYNLLPPPPDTPLITYIGKAGEFKGIAELCEALSHVHSDFRLLFLTNGGGRAHLEETISKNEYLKGRTSFLDFIPPWEIPSLLRSSSLLVHLEYKFPIPIHSPVQPFEAVSCGTPLLLSGEIHKKIKGFFRKTSELFSVAEDPSDIQTLSATLEKILASLPDIKKNAGLIREEFVQSAHWDAHVEAYERTFKKALPKIFSFFRR